MPRASAPARARSAVALVLAALAGAFATSARAENHVTIRGQYYRERSTRVIQPVAEIAQDLPAGQDVTAHYLIDAITSASAASGPSGDNIFTEYRSETSLSYGKTWSRARVGAGYRYSAESDYWSHTVFASLAVRLLQDTGTLALSFGQGFDAVGRRVQGAAPTPTPGARCMPGGARTCDLDTTFGGIGYTQVLSPTVLAQLGYEFAYLTGFLGSPYRMVTGFGFENVPDRRFRNAVAGRVGKYFPATGTSLQLHYRFYWDFYPGGELVSGGDPWQMLSHTGELRVFQRIGSNIELRFSGRHYRQGAARFWCDVRTGTDCYADMRLTNEPGSVLAASDPKLGPVRTTFVEGKIYWDAAALREVPFFDWFSAGTFELSYGRYFQSTMFGAAHVLQAGYTLPY